MKNVIDYNLLRLQIPHVWLQHDFALDPIIPPFDFHFRIYKRDLAILTEW